MRAGWVALVSFALGASALAQPSGGSANGALTVNGQEVKLTHAYAIVQEGAFDPSTEDVLVILSSTPLSPEAVEDEFERMKLSSTGWAGVEIVLGADGEPSSGSIYHPALSGPISASGMHRFESAGLDASSVKGRLFVDGPQEFFDRTYEYNVTFETPIHRPVQPTAEELAAAAGSPQAKAAMEFFRAAREGDAAALKKVLSAEAAKELDGPEGKDMLELIQAMAPQNPTVAGLKVNGSEAELTVTEKDGDTTMTSKVRLVLEDGVWKVGK